MTDRLREAPRPAVHASRPNPIGWTTIGRVLLVSSAVALVISLFGPFGGLGAFFRRAAEIFAYSWTGSLLGLVCARLLFRLGLGRYGPWAIGVGTGVVMAAPMATLVWLGNSVAIGRPLPGEALPTLVWDVALICVGASVLGVMVSRRPTATEAAPAPPKFLERLPLKLRGAEVWAVEAEDHYLRLHTSKGQDLILMRLSDAVDELHGVEGMQVHRSWWVARDAIADAKRGDGRATLTLKDGSQVPVSRTYAAQLRERGWI
jgi:hypothetical protein